jgi:hypothetical protein
MTYPFAVLGDRLHLRRPTAPAKAPDRCPARRPPQPAHDRAVRGLLPRSGRDRGCSGPREAWPDNRRRHRRAPPVFRRRFRPLVHRGLAGCGAQDAQGFFCRRPPRAPSTAAPRSMTAASRASSRPAPPPGSLRARSAAAYPVRESHDPGEISAVNAQGFAESDESANATGGANCGSQRFAGSHSPKWGVQASRRRDEAQFRGNSAVWRPPVHLSRCRGTKIVRIAARRPCQAPFEARDRDKTAPGSR